MTIEIKILSAGDEGILKNVAADVFDEAVQKNLSVEFLNDPRHHIAVAIEDGMVVGFASAVHYVHPDKAAELWINEAGVAPTHQNKGAGKQLLGALFKLSREIGCREAWVLTNRANTQAMRFYASMGGVESTEDEVMFTFQLDNA